MCLGTSRLAITLIIAVAVGGVGVEAPRAVRGESHQGRSGTRFGQQRGRTRDAPVSRGPRRVCVSERRTRLTQLPSAFDWPYTHLRLQPCSGSCLHPHSTSPPPQSHVPSLHPASHPLHLFLFPPKTRPPPRSPVPPSPSNMPPSDTRPTVRLACMSRPPPKASSSGTSCSSYTKVRGCREASHATCFLKQSIALDSRLLFRFHPQIPNYLPSELS